MRKGGAAHELQKKRTSVWRRVVWFWREEADVLAKKNLNSVMYVSGHVFQNK